MKNNVRQFPLPLDLSKGQQRLLDTVEQIYGEETLQAGELGFIHTLHANCYLPRRRIAEKKYIHTNGPFSVLLEGGSLLDPATNSWLEQPLPYGGKPRALLAYISTFAKQNRTREVPVGRSFTDFVRMMNGEATGGANGSIKLWKQQFMALSASTMRIGVNFGDGKARTKKVDITDEIEVWFAPEPNQLSLFPSEVVLTQEYYDLLEKHAMPVDMRALRALVHDPLAFDIYVWLAYRLCRLRKPNGQLLSWDVLHQQFGGGYKLVRQFKPRFIAAMRKAIACYPGACVDDADRGIVIRPSPAPIRGEFGQPTRFLASS